ncbi:MAG: hypothetical protein JNK15_15490 [Planctomycetes bacterium]|nr:hypothetical protein [Planctomycetota bacterium]
MIPRHALLSFLVASAPLFAQAEIDLRTTAKKSTAVWLVQEDKQTQIIDASGQEFETTTTIRRTLQVVVQDADDKGNLVVECQIARITGAMAMPMGMGDIEFDSLDAPKKDDEEEDDGGMMGFSPGAMKKALTMGAGKSFKAKVSPYGKVVELLDGSKELLASGEEGAMGGNLDQNSLEEMVESAFGNLPEKATAVGAKWQHVGKGGKAQMPMESKLELTLAAANDETFEITANGTIEKPAEKADDKKADAKGEEEDQAAEMREMLKGMKMKNGKVTGATKISRKDGFVVDATTTTNVDVEMETPMGSMNMTMKMVRTINRTNAADAMKKADAKAEAPKEAAKDETKSGK